MSYNGGPEDEQESNPMAGFVFLLLLIVFILCSVGIWTIDMALPLKLFCQAAAVAVLGSLMGGLLAAG